MSSMSIAAAGKQPAFDAQALSKLSPQDKFSLLESTTLASGSLSARLASLTDPEHIKGHPVKPYLELGVVSVGFLNIFLRFTPLRIITDLAFMVLSGGLVGSAVANRQDLINKEKVVDSLKDTESRTKMKAYLNDRKWDAFSRATINLGILGLGVVGSLGALSGLLSVPLGIALLAGAGTVYVMVNMIGNSIFTHRDTLERENMLIDKLKQDNL